MPRKTMLMMARKLKSKMMKGNKMKKRMKLKVRKMREIQVLIELEFKKVCT